MVFDWKSRSFPGYKPVRENSIFCKIVNVHWPGDDILYTAIWRFDFVPNVTAIDGFTPCSPVVAPFPAGLTTLQASHTNSFWTLRPNMPQIFPNDGKLVVTGTPQTPPNVVIPDNVLIIETVGSTNGPGDGVAGTIIFQTSHFIGPAQCYGIQNITSFFGRPANALLDHGVRAVVPPSTGVTATIDGDPATKVRTQIGWDRIGITFLIEFEG